MANVHRPDILPSCIAEQDFKRRPQDQNKSWGLFFNAIFLKSATLIGLEAIDVHCASFGRLL